MNGSPLMQRALTAALVPPARRPDPVFPTYIAVRLQNALEKNRPEGAPLLVVDDIAGSANDPPVIAHVRDPQNGQRYRVTVEVL